LLERKWDLQENDEDITVGFNKYSFMMQVLQSCRLVLLCRCTEYFEIVKTKKIDSLGVTKSFFLYQEIIQGFTTEEALVVFSSSPQNATAREKGLLIAQEVNSHVLDRGGIILFFVKKWTP